MSDQRLLRLATGWALIVGPALFLLDNLIHPEELSRGNEAEQLAAIAAASERWQLAHLIGFLSGLVFAVIVVGLAVIVRRTQPRLGLWAGVAGGAGLMGLAFALALDGYTWGVLGEVSGRPEVDSASIEAAFAEVQESAWALPYYALTIAWIGAMVALARGAARGGWIGAGSAALLAAGSIAVGIEGLVPSNAYFIASSALLLVGGIAAGRDVLRLDDAGLAAPVRSA